MMVRVWYLYPVIWFELLCPNNDRKIAAIHIKSKTALSTDLALWHAGLGYHSHIMM